ncbi:MAG TPA: VOC family protein [Nitrospirales bacterium]|nr:VOC family protein [Nitrospirales bacterium]
MTVAVLALLLIGTAVSESIAACSTGGTASFEGVQIETSDISLYETFFGEVLQATEVQRRDHPGLDNLRGYCYRDVLVVVRQDLKTARPTGWVQINFTVPDAAAVQSELEGRIAKMDDGRKAAIARLRLKPDVRRGDCKATRLEVGGPEGFMVGFDQIKPETCEASSHHR